MRLMQHKREAYWFYRYLSIFYDKLVNPLFWTEHMRETALDQGGWTQADQLQVIDVGSGTGFTTEGIVKRVPAANVSCVDQSPHQMSHAKAKTALQDCKFQVGDAEDIPYPTDSFDRYVSAGSIEYWPHPQQGINESYRVLKSGGKALMIGPIEPQNAISKFIANAWMLFPPEADYHRWYQEAGFTDLQWTYVRPHWQKNERYGIALIGTKPAPGLSPNAEAVAQQARQDQEESGKMSLGRRILFFFRLLIGSFFGGLFIPMALIAHLLAPLRGIKGPRQPLNKWQIGVLVLTAVLIGGLIYWIL
ncbi:MAG: methyltransferase domain-containing protein [Bacteroidota bacterium]